MKAILFAIAAATASLGSAPALAWQGEISVSPMDEANAIYMRMVEAFDARDWELVRSEGDALMAHPVWGNLRPEFQARVQTQIAIAYSVEDADRALELYADAEPNSEYPAGIYYMRSLLLADLERWADAARDLQLLSTTNPEAFGSLEIRFLWDVVNGLEEIGDEAAEHSMIETIVDHYVSDDPFISADFFRLELARHYADEGQARRALLMAREIDLADAIAEFQFDGTFEALWSLPDFDRVADVSAALDREIATLEALLEAHPNSLHGAQNYIRALSKAGRHADADAYARSLQQRLQTSPDLFLDAADYENWFLNEWAYVAFALGDWQTGEARMREAAALSEGGGQNVSQMINLASAQIRRGGFEDALATLADFQPENASEFGQRFVWSIRACALFSLGRDGEAEGYLEQLEDGWDTNVAALQQVYLCNGDENASAEFFIRRLEDDRWRPGALEAVQGMRQMFPCDVYPDHCEWRERLTRMHARPDVREAVARHGRIVDLPIVDTYWGNI